MYQIVKDQRFDDHPLKETTEAHTVDTSKLVQSQLEGNLIKSIKITFAYTLQPNSKNLHTGLLLHIKKQVFTAPLLGRVKYIKPS